MSEGETPLPPPGTIAGSFEFLGEKSKIICLGDLEVARDASGKLRMGVGRVDIHLTRDEAIWLAISLLDLTR